MEVHTVAPFAAPQLSYLCLPSPHHRAPEPYTLKAPGHPPSSREKSEGTQGTLEHPLLEHPFVLFTPIQPYTPSPDFTSLRVTSKVSQKATSNEKMSHFFLYLLLLEGCVVP